MPTPTKYTYSIANDTVNGKVNSGNLKSEIAASTIVIALDFIETGGDVLDIWFKDVLVSGDQTTLTSIVAAHSGEELPSDNLSVVLVNPTQRFTHGYNTSSGSVLTVMRATAYTEQTSNAQRSLVSSSTDDDLSGTGARQIQITYYDQNMNGPYVEIVDMSGTTPVNTANTNLCYIEKIEVETVGSQLGNVGTITLKADVAGGGATIGTIAAGDGTTYWAHHYVSADKTMYLVSFMGTTKGIDTGALEIRRTVPTDSSKPEKSVTPKLRIAPGTSNTFGFAVPIMITGPAQITMYGRSDASSGTLDWSVAMDYYEE